MTFSDGQSSYRVPAARGHGCLQRRYPVLQRVERAAAAGAGEARGEGRRRGGGARRVGRAGLPLSFLLRQGERQASTKRQDRHPETLRFAEVDLLLKRPVWADARELRLFSRTRRAASDKNRVHDRRMGKSRATLKNATNQCRPWAPATGTVCYPPPHPPLCHLSATDASAALNAVSPGCLLLLASDFRLGFPLQGAEFALVGIMFVHFLFLFFGRIFA